MFEWFNEVFDVTLLATIGLIFVATLIGAYLRASRRDPCLKSFDGYNVTLEHADNKVVWGKLELAATGLELRYASSVQDVRHVESSFILYGEEFASIQAIYRYIDQLDEESRARRKQDLRRSFRPGPLRRLTRSLRNFMSVASESMAEVAGVIVGRLRRPAGRYITDEGETQIKNLSSTFITHVGTGYDPLLERFIGQKMVFEVVEDDEVHEHVGIFKQYSPDFFEILDVQFPQREQISIDEDGAPPSDLIEVTRQGASLHIANRSQKLLLIHALEIDDHEEPLNVVVDTGESIDLHPETPFGVATLHFRVTRELDMIMPRHRCVVRHRADYHSPEVLPSIVFDLGVKLSGGSKLAAREARLRRQLQENPNAVTAMNNLGALLLQKQEYAEARRYLNQAWRLRFSLPDNGRRTELLLQELDRKQNAWKRYRVEGAGDLLSAGGAFSLNIADG